MCAVIPRKCSRVHKTTVLQSLSVFRKCSRCRGQAIRASIKRLFITAGCVCCGRALNPRFWMAVAQGYTSSVLEGLAVGIGSSFEFILVSEAYLLIIDCRAEDLPKYFYKCPSS